MQTTLDCPATSSAIEIQKSSLNFTDEHINYLFENSQEGKLQEQIGDKLLEEKAEENWLKMEEDKLREVKGFFSPKKQEYIRVRKNK